MTPAEAQDLIASITPERHGLGTLTAIPAVATIAALTARNGVRKAG